MDEKMNIEELKKQCLEAEKNFKILHEQLAQMMKEEEETKQAKLRAEKEARRKEVDDAFNKYIELHKAYEKDYGHYIISRNFINEFPWNLFWN